MNKKARVFSLVFAIMFFLTACGNVSQEENIESTDEMTYVDDLNREVTYSPDKIVADYYIGELLYLDANLVGADLTYKSDIWPEEKLENVEDVGQSLEAIANLSPTLIITLNKDLLEQYEVIAPTIYIEYGKDKPSDLLKKFGEILGKSDEFENIMKEFTEEIEEIKATIDHPEYTYTIAQDLNGETYLYGSNWGRGGFILYDYLDLKGTEDAEESYINKSESYLTLSKESLPDYIGDVIIIFTDTNSKDYENNSITQNPLFEETQCYKNDNIYYIDDDYMYDDPYSVKYLLNYYKEMLEGEL